ncbi:MAG: hypothetical protein QNJ03_07130 [Dinoroseobacter sp.]|nr:hypothetical protein [Dinoroseobacter sp.]
MQSRILARASRNTSTPTCKRAGLALTAFFLVAGLSGCLQAPGEPAQREVTVSRSAVTIAGPSGFCIDPATLRDEEEGAFVLLGNCAAIARAPRQPQPEVRALLTAAVQELGSVSIRDQGAEVAEFLKTEDGRALLSRSGDASSVGILNTRKSGDVLYLHAYDKSPGYAPGMSSEQWRAMLDIEGAIVSLTVLGFEDDPLSADAGMATVREFASIIRRENAK